LLAVMLLGACSGGEEVPTASTSSTVTAVTTSSTTSVPAIALDVPLIAAVGDSQLFESLDELRAALPTADLRDHARIGLRTEEGHFGLDALMPLDPEAVVVVLGTNDALDGRISDDELEAQDQLARSLGDTPCVRWVEVVETSPSETVNEAARVVNRRLVENAGRYGFELVAWAEQVAVHPEWVREDGIHFTPAGQLALAETIATALGPCADLIIR
jgi:hypothetical protein